MSNSPASEPQLTNNALTVLERRYLKRNEQGQVLEQPADMFRRVAHVVAAGENLFEQGQDAAALEEEFYGLLTSLEFLANSPTLMNAGRELVHISG